MGSTVKKQPFYPHKMPLQSGCGRRSHSCCERGETAVMKDQYRLIFLMPLCLTVGPSVSACITCNKKVREAIFDSTFYPNLLAMLSPFILLTLIVTGLAVFFGKRHTAYISRNGAGKTLNPVPLSTAALVLGMGFGGFMDGIALHQILQWHEMLSNKLPPTDLVAKTVNMFWDGIFHAFCLLVSLAGVVMLWRAGQRTDASRSGRLLAGGLIAGWGVFNIVEGILDHQVLRLHNVREITPNVQAWNFGFLGFSIVLLGVGWALMNRSLAQN